MYNALAEIMYRMSLDEYEPNLKHKTSSSLIHSFVEWDKDFSNEKASEVKPESGTDFIQTFLLERPQG